MGFRRNLSALRVALGLASLFFLCAVTPSPGVGLEGPRADRLMTSGAAVDGTATMVVELPLGVEIRSYRNHGYQIQVEGRTARVSVELRPVESRARFGDGPPLSHTARRGDPLTRLALALTAGAETDYEATSRILDWVSRNIEYRLDRRAPQSARQVFVRRSGYCTGIARLSVELLRRVGIEAREVPGIIAGRSVGEHALFHRWIEVLYPDRGWVFSDPLKFHHYVPASYIPLYHEVLKGRLPGPATVRWSRDGIEPVDVYPSAAIGVRARRNAEGRLSGALRVLGPRRPSTPMIAELEGQGVRRRRPARDGEAVFLGVEPGSYVVRIFAGGRLERQGRIHLAQHHRVTVDLRRGGRTSSPVGHDGAMERSSRNTRSLFSDEKR